MNEQERQARIAEINQHIDEVGMTSNEEEAELGRLTAEQENEWLDYQNSLAPTETAEEADIENKAAIVSEFCVTCARLIDLIDELDNEDMLPQKTPADREFWDTLRDSISTAKYQFDPDLDDHSREE